MVANTDYGREINTSPYYVIPYTVGEDIVELVRIAKFQYRTLLKFYKSKGFFSEKLYERTLMEFKNQSKTDMINIFTFDWLIVIMSK